LALTAPNLIEIAVSICMDTGRRRAEIEQGQPVSNKADDRLLLFETFQIWCRKLPTICVRKQVYLNKSKFETFAECLLFVRRLLKRKRKECFEATLLSVCIVRLSPVLSKPEVAI
jgi:hypothetical protein